MIYEYANLRFTAAKMRPDNDDDPAWYIYVQRISSGVHLSSQIFLDHEPTEVELEGLAQRWILTAAGNDDPKPTLCYNCHAELVPDFGDTDYQFDGCLWIEFHGGYGMFIDPMYEPDPKVVICHECAHDLCDKVEWVNRLLEPESSHSHKQPEPYNTLKAQGHKGWDLQDLGEK